MCEMCNEVGSDSLEFYIDMPSGQRITVLLVETEKHLGEGFITLTGKGISEDHDEWYTTTLTARYNSQFYNSKQAKSVLESLVREELYKSLITKCLS